MANGHCAQAAWATAERMSVLLAKPIDGPCATPHDYEIEESSRFTVNAADGELLGAVPRQGRDDGAARRPQPRRSSTAPSRACSPTAASACSGLPREHRELVEKLDADGGRGYLPVDVTWREAGPGLRAVDVILSRPRP